MNSYEALGPFIIQISGFVNGMRVKRTVPNFMAVI